MGRNRVKTTRIFDKNCTGLESTRKKNKRKTNKNIEKIIIEGYNKNWEELNEN